MKKIVFIILIIATTFNSCKTIIKKSNPVIPNNSKTEFNNQGEQEDYWVKELFKQKYKKHKYKKFNGQITIIDSITIKYNEKTLIIINTRPELISIFQRGIFYPNVITGNYTAEVKSKQELDSMTTEQKVFYNITRTDSLTISNFEELQFLSESPEYKRFRFWLFRKGMMNPTVYFIELTNKKASKHTELADFIEKAKLTFFEKGWLIL